MLEKTDWNRCLELFITHRSALEYWRLHRTPPGNNRQRNRRVKVPSDPPGLVLSRRTDIAGLNLPLDVTTSSSNSRRRSHTVRAHLLSRSLSEGCAVDVGDGLYVASPEFAFMQVANELSTIELVELGLEICGSYSLSIPGASDAGLSASAETRYELAPLSSVKKMMAFATRTEGMPGRRNALGALRYIVDNSASPMESVLVMLLTLPYRLGGYKLPLPILNTRITMPRRAEDNTTKSYYICDLYWPKVKVAAEYDSDMYHATSYRIGSDSIRRADLASAGTTLVTVTNQQIRRIAEFDQVAGVLATLTGKRLNNNRNVKFIEARQLLRKELLSDIRL